MDHTAMPQATAVEEARITIVGLGLMGGSLAAALKARYPRQHVSGVARRADAAQRAVERGLVDRAATELAPAVAEADIIVLAAPVRAILELLPQVGQLAKPGCLVMDLGSTKAAITRAMSKLPGHVQPVGGHPMCGKETSGLDAAEPGLYQGRTFVLTPLERTSAEALSLATDLVEALGGRPLLLDAERHDRLVATISHLPYLLACGLVGTAEQASQGEDDLWPLAASGFRDTSRLAASDVTMMLDILLTNREMVLEALNMCQGNLHRLADLVSKGEPEGLRTVLTGIRERRKGMFV